jgi:hypothetical protein
MRSPPEVDAPNRVGYVPHCRERIPNVAGQEIVCEKNASIGTADSHDRADAD